MTTYRYEPDYAVPPGWLLKERLEVHGISQAEFARRCARSPKLISEIIAGKAPLEPATALQFEKVLGVHADIWLGTEAAYRLLLAREAELRTNRSEKAISWAQGFPVDDLTKRGMIDRSSSPADAVPILLSFFGVASVDAWHVKYRLTNVAYRHSPSFESDKKALTTWLRLGEFEAARQRLAGYNRARFIRSLREIRELTASPIKDGLKRAVELCNHAGVALALVEPFQKTALSGAAWWLSPSSAIMELSARHKSDDHLWFSLFHEAAHLVLHSKKSVFVDGPDSETADLEEQANEWAADVLCSHAAWSEFVEAACFSERSVLEFAAQQGIAPSIVVGRLQHQKIIPWNRLNGLKLRLEWA